MEKYVTLVLSGGGARGIAHIGAIEEIERRGYIIKSIAGTSMGALVGGVYAVGKIQEFKEWICTLDKQSIFKLLDFSFSPQGLIKGDRVLKTMKKFIPDAKIEDLDIKYTATAFDLANNTEVVFTTGNLYDAIRASISIPTVFTPVFSGKSVLVDGGVVNNIPINNAIRIEDDIMLAIDVNADIPFENPYLHEIERNRIRTHNIIKKNKVKSSLIISNSQNQEKGYTYFNLINKTIASMTHRIAQMTINNHPPDILIEVSHNSCGTFDFFKAKELVEIGRYSAQKKFDSLKNNFNYQEISEKHSIKMLEL